MIIFLVVLVVALFLGYKFIPVYWQNEKYESAIREHLNWDRFYEGATPPTEDSVYPKVRESAKTILGVDINEQAVNAEEYIQVGRLQQGQEPFPLYVKAKYKRIVNLPILGAKVLVFEIYEVQEKD